MASRFSVHGKHISQKARVAFRLLVIAQLAHSIEEYLFRLYDVFPPARFVSGLISTDLRIGFIAFNVAFVTFGFWCYAVPVRKGSSAAIPLLWLWVVVEILNGIGHPVISILERSYIPGTATAPFLLVIAVYLLIEIAKSQSNDLDYPV
jgi:Protein of unknown function with HXXEE motif